MNSTGALRQCGINQRAILTAAIAAAGAALFTASDVQAQVPIDWNNPATGNYVDPLNWTPNATPGNAADHAATINTGGTANINAGDAAEAAWLNLGLQPGQSGTIEMFDGTLTLGEMRIGGREVLPDLSPNGGGTGTFIQHAGNVLINAASGAPGDPDPVQSLYLGDGGLTTGNTANGTYTIKGGTLLSGTAANDGITIGTGVGSIGTFIHEGGDVTSTGFVTVGRRGATATYTMTGGTLTTQGDVGITLADGDEAGATSTTATFTHSAGTVSSNRDVIVARRNGTGTYSISGNAILNVGATTGSAGGSLIIGGTAEASAVLMNSTGTVNIGGNAVVNIGETTDTANGNFNIGFSANSATLVSTAQGTVNMDGGTVTLHKPGAIMAVGNGNGATGTLNISGGTLNVETDVAGPPVVTADLDVGRNRASGTVNLSGTGTINVSRLIMNSTDTPGAVRKFNVTGGTLNADQITFGTAPTPSSATRELNISGGTVDIGFITTGRPNVPAGGSALTHISGGNVTIDSLEIFSLSTFKVSGADRTLVSAATTTPQPNYRFGTANIDIAGTTTLTIAGPGNFGAGTAQTLTKLGTGTLRIDAVQLYAANSTINVTSGALTLNTNAGEGMDAASPARLALTVSGAANFGSNQKLRGLTVNGGAVATVVGDAVDKTLRLPAPTINAGGKLDMTDNDMIVDYDAPTSPEFALRDNVLLFRNGPGTEGIGFTETAAEDVVLAFADAGEMAITSFNGFTIDNTTVVGKYTYYGDGNLDGQVTTDDYVAVDLGLGTGDSWNQGDFDLNGVVTTDDYVVVDLNLGKGTTNPLAFADEQARMIALHTEMFGQSYVEKLAYASEFGWVAASVPEPGALGLIGLGAIGLLRRRRRS